MHFTTCYIVNRHIIEFRKRLIFCCGIVIGLFLIFFINADALYTAIDTPLLKQAPNVSLIATQVTAPFLVPMKLSFIVSIFAGMPFLLYQGWAFIIPGLYKHEKKYLTSLVFMS